MQRSSSQQVERSGAAGGRVHTSLRSYAGDALRAMGNTTSRRSTAIDDSLAADLATLSGQQLSTHNAQGQPQYQQRGGRSRSPYSGGRAHNATSRANSSSPANVPSHNNNHNTREGAAGVPSRTVGDLANLSAIADVPPMVAPNVLLSGAHAVRIRVRLEALWDDMRSSYEMRTAIEWHLASLAALEERWAIATSAAASSKSQHTFIPGSQPTSIFRKQQPQQQRAQPTGTHDSPDLIEKDVKLHLFYLEEHMSLLIEEQKLHRAIRDKLAYRTRLMEQLKLCASKYRSTITQHILLAHQQQSKAPYPSLFSAPRHVGPSSSAIVYNVLQEVHHLLDAYRIVTVEVVELHTQWRHWILSGNFFGAASRMPSSSEKWEASVPVMSTADGLLGPGETMGMGFHHHTLPTEFHKRRYKTRQRECFTISPHGLPLLVYMARDLFLKSFIGEPLCVLLGLSIDWNPLALPGLHWSILADAPGTKSSDTKAQLRQQRQQRTTSATTTPRGPSAAGGTSALSSLFSKYAKDHRWRALVASPSSPSSSAAAATNNGDVDVKNQYLTYFAKEHTRILQQQQSQPTQAGIGGKSMQQQGTTPRGASSSWNVSSIPHTSSIGQHSSYAPGTFVVPSSLYRYAEGRSAAAVANKWPPHPDKQVRDATAAAGRVSGFSTDIEDQYNRCDVALSTIKAEVELRSVTRIQALIRGVQCRERIWETLTASVAIQRVVRGHLGRRCAQRKMQERRRRVVLIAYLGRRCRSSPVLLRAQAGRPPKDSSVAPQQQVTTQELEHACFSIASHVIVKWLMYRHRRLQGKQHRLAERVRRLQAFGRQVLTSKATRRCMLTLKRLRNVQIKLGDSEVAQRRAVVTDEANCRGILSHVIMPEATARFQLVSASHSERQALHSRHALDGQAIHRLKHVAAEEASTRVSIAGSEELGRESLDRRSHESLLQSRLLALAVLDMTSSFHNDRDTVTRLHHWFRAEILIPLYYMKMLNDAYVKSVVATWDDESSARQLLQAQWEMSFATVEQRMASNLTTSAIKDALDETQAFAQASPSTGTTTTTTTTELPSTPLKGQQVTSSLAAPPPQPAGGGSPSIKFLRSLFPTETTSTSSASMAAPSLAALVTISNEATTSTTTIVASAQKPPSHPPSAATPPAATPTKRAAADDAPPLPASPSINFLRSLFPGGGGDRPPTSPSLNILATMATATEVKTAAAVERAPPPRPFDNLGPVPPAPRQPPVTGTSNLGPVPPAIAVQAPKPVTYDNLGPVPPPPALSSSSPVKYDDLGPVPPPASLHQPPPVKYDALGPVPPPPAAVVAAGASAKYDNLGPVPPPLQKAPQRTTVAYDNLGPVPPPPPPPPPAASKSTVAPSLPATPPQRPNYDNLGPVPPPPGPPVAQPTTSLTPQLMPPSSPVLASPSLQFLRALFPSASTSPVPGAQPISGAPSLGELIQTAALSDEQPRQLPTPTAAIQQASSTNKASSYDALGPVPPTPPPPPQVAMAAGAANVVQLAPVPDTAAVVIERSYRSLPEMAIRALRPHVLILQRCGRGFSVRTKHLAILSKCRNARRAIYHAEARGRLELTEVLHRVLCTSAMSWREDAHIPSGNAARPTAAIAINPERPLQVLRSACVAFALLQRSKRVEAARREHQRLKRLAAVMVLRPWAKAVVRGGQLKNRPVNERAPHEDALQELQAIALSLMTSTVAEEVDLRSSLMHAMIFHGHGRSVAEVRVPQATVTLDEAPAGRDTAELHTVVTDEGRLRGQLTEVYTTEHTVMQTRLMAALDIGIRLRREVLAEVMDRNAAAALLQHGIKRWVVASWAAVQVQRHLRQLHSAMLVRRASSRSIQFAEAASNTSRWQSVRIIASYWLRKATRIRAARVREEERIRNSQRHAVEVIQAAMHRWRASMTDAERRARHIRSAVKLGASMDTNTSHYHAAAEAAAIRLQCFYRRRCATRAAAQLRAQEEEALRRLQEDRAVRHIQLVWKHAMERRRATEEAAAVVASRCSSVLPQPTHASTTAPHETVSSAAVAPTSTSSAVQQVIPPLSLAPSPQGTFPLHYNSNAVLPPPAQLEPQQQRTTMITTTSTILDSIDVTTPVLHNPSIAPSSLPISGRLRTTAAAPIHDRADQMPPRAPPPFVETSVEAYHSYSSAVISSSAPHNSSASADDARVPTVAGVVSGKLRGGSPQRPRDGSAATAQPQAQVAGQLRTSPLRQQPDRQSNAQTQAPTIPTATASTPPAAVVSDAPPLPQLVQPLDQVDDLFDMLTGSGHMVDAGVTTSNVKSHATQVTTTHMTTTASINLVVGTSHQGHHRHNVADESTTSTAESLPSAPPSPTASVAREAVAAPYMAPALRRLVQAPHVDDDADGLDWDQVILGGPPLAGHHASADPDVPPAPLSARSSIPELSDDGHEDDSKPMPRANGGGGGNYPERAQGSNAASSATNKSLDDSAPGDLSLEDDGAAGDANVSAATITSVYEQRVEQTFSLPPNPMNARNAQLVRDHTTYTTLQRSQQPTALVPHDTNATIASARPTTVLWSSSHHDTTTHQQAHLSSPYASGATGASRLTFDTLRKYGPTYAGNAANDRGESLSALGGTRRWDGAGRVAPLRALVRKQHDPSHGDDELTDYELPSDRSHHAAPHVRVDPFALTTTGGLDTPSLPDLDDDNWGVTTTGSAAAAQPQTLSSASLAAHLSRRRLNGSAALDVTLSEASLNSSLHSDDEPIRGGHMAPYRSGSAAATSTFRGGHHGDTIQRQAYAATKVESATHYAPPLSSGSMPSTSSAPERRHPLYHATAAATAPSHPWSTVSTMTNAVSYNAAHVATTAMIPYHDHESTPQSHYHRFSVVAAGSPLSVARHHSTVATHSPPHASPSSAHSERIVHPNHVATPTRTPFSGDAPATPLLYDRLFNAAQQSHHQAPQPQHNNTQQFNAPPPFSPVSSAPHVAHSYYAAHNNSIIQHSSLSTPIADKSRYLPNITVDPPSSPRGSPRRRIAQSRSPLGTAGYSPNSPGHHSHSRGGGGGTLQPPRQSNEFLSPLRRPADMMHSAERNRRILQRHLFSGDDD